MQMKTDIRITADDASLAATLYHDASATSADTVVILNSAMGTPRDFYSPFAEYFAGKGVDVLCWDYRGVGDSLQGSIENSSACIHDWGERDLPAVIEWMHVRYPQRRLVLIAHSVGGQIIGMAANAERIERFVLIGSQSGYWRLWSGWQQLRIALIWHIVIPLVSRLYGYFPARFFGLGVHLPNSVVRQWARWGRDPHYLMGRHRRPSAANYTRIHQRMLNVWVSDDEIASLAANRRMLSWYPNADTRNWNIVPAELGVERIGHFRLFRETVGARFWPRLLEWLDS